MQFPIAIGLHRSRFVALALWLIVACGTLVIAAFPRSTAVQALMCLMLWGGAAWSWRALRPAFGGLLLERDGHLRLLDAEGRPGERARLMPGATVHPWLIVMQLLVEHGGRPVLVLAPDSMAPEEFRRLRVFLRWQAGFSEPDGGA